MSPRAPRTIGSGWKIRKLGRRWEVGDQDMEQDDSQMNVLGSHLRVTAHPGSLWGVSWDSCGSRNPRLPPEGMAGGSVTLSLMPWVQALWPSISSPPSPLAAFTQPPLPRTPTPRLIWTLVSLCSHHRSETRQVGGAASLLKSLFSVF